MSAQSSLPKKTAKSKAAQSAVKLVSSDGADTLAAVAPELSGMLRILTCGSVDDGKSTLIGRLLWDATDLYDDQRETLQRGKKVDGGNPDFSLLMDGLVAEREQGITIDIAWRYFDTQSRRFVVIDSPGHEQYTRNMASGASHADVALLLIDSRHGIKRQTRRHAAILDLVGVKRVILIVNKMDLSGWSEDVFRKIEADFKALSLSFGFWRPLRSRWQPSRATTSRASRRTCPGTRARTCSSTSKICPLAALNPKGPSASPCRPFCATAAMTSAASPVP